MSEREPRSFGESFDALRVVQEDLQRRGYYFYPVEKEHTEALLTDPLIQLMSRPSGPSASGDRRSRGRSYAGAGAVRFLMQQPRCAILTSEATKNLVSRAGERPDSPLRSA